MGERAATEHPRAKDLPSSRRFRRRRKRREAEQRYWDFFLHATPKDPDNNLVHQIRSAPQGSINSVRTDGHTPEIMSEHVKEIARTFGADLVAILALDPSKDLPPRFPEQARFAILSVVPAEQDPEASPGIGGQLPVQNGLMVSFILAAFFRESGYFATTRAESPEELAELAVRAGLGSLDARGRLRTARHGTKLWVADVVFTDFPLARTS